MRTRTHLSSSVSIASGLAVIASAAIVHAQTVADVAAKGACETSGVVGLSDQLVKVQMCLTPGTFVAITPHAGITLASGTVKPFMLASSRDALWAAAGSLTLDVTSAFRTLSDQYVLYYSGGCSLAAKPGNSNHETGKAVDLSNWSAAVGAMEAAGCVHSYPSTDPVHFDCPGADERASSIKAFQHLWNVNNPGDLLTEDGAYGPSTESRLAKSPAGGFTNPADCAAPTTPDWAGAFVDQSFPKAPAGVLTMTAGSDVAGWIELKNIGGKAWDGKTFLGTTGPRDRKSPFVGGGWVSASRPATAGGIVSPGGTHKFMFTLHAPDKPGDYDERYGMVQEGTAWFSDPGQGGPADDLLQVKIKVVAPGGDGGALDAGRDAATSDGGRMDGGRFDGSLDDSGVGDDETAVSGSSAGCGCRTTGGSAPARNGLAALAILGLVVGARRRRSS